MLTWRFATSESCDDWGEQGWQPGRVMQGRPARADAGFAIALVNGGSMAAAASSSWRWVAVVVLGERVRNGA